MNKLKTYNRDKAQYELGKHLKECPVCKEKELSVGTGFSHRQFTVKGATKHIPLITVICTVCGYCLEFSAAYLDFMENSD